MLIECIFDDNELTNFIIDVIVPRLFREDVSLLLPRLSCVVKINFAFVKFYVL
jgi:hypothetical protein